MLRLKKYRLFLEMILENTIEEFKFENSILDSAAFKTAEKNVYAKIILQRKKIYSDN